MRGSAVALTKALLKVGEDKDWEVDVIGTRDGRILVVRLDTEQVIGEVLEVGDVVMFATPKSLVDFDIEEAA